MFVFVQHYKSNKAATYSENECSADMDCARAYAETLLNASVDVKSVDLFRYEGTIEKVERAEWFF